MKLTLAMAPAASESTAEALMIECKIPEGRNLVDVSAFGRLPTRLSGMRQTQGVSMRNSRARKTHRTQTLRGRQFSCLHSLWTPTYFGRLNGRQCSVIKQQSISDKMADTEKSTHRGYM